MPSESFFPTSKPKVEKPAPSDAEWERAEYETFTPEQKEALLNSELYINEDSHIAGGILNHVVKLSPDGKYCTIDGQPISEDQGRRLHVKYFPIAALQEFRRNKNEKPESELIAESL